MGKNDSGYRVQLAQKLKGDFYFTDVNLNSHLQCQGVYKWTVMCGVMTMAEINFDLGKYVYFPTGCYVHWEVNVNCINMFCKCIVKQNIGLIVWCVLLFNIVDGKMTTHILKVYVLGNRYWKWKFFDKNMAYSKFVIHRNKLHKHTNWKKGREI